MSSEKYVVVTATSTHRMRYVVPVSELQKLNTNTTIDDDKAIEWAQDSVVCEDVAEFSQHYMGEHIVDTEIVDEQQILNLWDRDNDYMANLTTEEKLKRIHDWKDPYKQKQTGTIL